MCVGLNGLYPDVLATYLSLKARRAFRALKGIIRLQALIRGHLVRRQAVATLRCMQAIIKLQSVVVADKSDFLMLKVKYFKSADPG